MYKIRVLSFCFRKLPNYFNVWLKSAGKNPEIDFLVVTSDTKQYGLPANVVIEHHTFDEVMQKVRNTFDCPIDIQDPYKFCDLRPMFGYLFPEWFAGYDFWGGCDLDVVFGNIRAFITDEVLRKHDKILTRDHFYLYRNTKEVNERFMLPVMGKENFYQQVLGDHLLYCFGERKPWGMYFLYLDHGFSMYDVPVSADIFYKRKSFQVDVGCTTKGQIFVWRNGKLYATFVKENGTIDEKEYMYIHLQKRPMDAISDAELQNDFAIVPNQFLAIRGLVSKELILRNSKEPLIYSEYVKQLIARIKKPSKEIFYQG